MSGQTSTISPVPKMTRDAPIAWVDIETTGTMPHRHAVLSIGVVRSDGQEREWYVMPSFDDISDAEPKALAVNGYTPEKWKERGWAVPHRVATEFAAFVDGHVLGAHNAAFDFPFLRALCDRFAVPLNVPHRPICTVSMLWPIVIAGEIESPSGEVACKHFGISLDNAHDALADARRAKALYEAVLKWHDGKWWANG